MDQKKFSGLVRCYKTATEIQALVALDAFHMFFINRCIQVSVSSYSQTLNEIRELVELRLPQSVKNAVHDSLWEIRINTFRRTITPSESDYKLLLSLLHKSLGPCIQFNARGKAYADQWFTLVEGMSIECLSINDHNFSQGDIQKLAKASSIKKLVLKECGFERAACQHISKIRNLEQVHYEQWWKGAVCLDLAKALADVSTLQCLMWHADYDYRELSIASRGISHLVLKKDDCVSDITTKFIETWDEACRKKGIPQSLRVIEHGEMHLALHHYQFDEIPFDDRGPFP